MTDQLQLHETQLLLDTSEGQYLEFKENISNHLCREFVAFANSEGGRMILGVSDDKTVVGLTVTNRDLATLFDLARNCDPPIIIEAHPIDYHGKNLIVVRIPEGDRKPYGCKDGCFFRSGATTQKMKRDELVRFVRKASEIRFDEQICEDFVYPRDFDEEAFTRFVTATNISLSGINRSDLLVNLGVAKQAGDEIKRILGTTVFHAIPLSLIYVIVLAWLKKQVRESNEFAHPSKQIGWIPHHLIPIVSFLLPLNFQTNNTLRRSF